MDYQIEKIKFIKCEKKNEVSGTVNLKKIQSIINSIKNITMNNVNNVVLELKRLDFTNFLEDVVSSLLESKNQPVQLKMLLIFELSASYTEFDETLLGPLREKIRNNMKQSAIVGLTCLYAEICVSSIEKPEKFEKFIVKTFSISAFGDYTLKNMYELVGFFKSQLKELEVFSIKEGKNVTELVEFYQKNILTLKNIFIKINNKSTSVKYRNLLFDMFNITNSEIKSHSLISLTEQEKNFYSLDRTFDTRQKYEQQNKLMSEDVVNNIRRTAFVAQNLNRSQRTSGFIFSLVEKVSHLKYLAKLTFLADIDVHDEILKQLGLASNTNSTILYIKNGESTKVLFFACELFKFHLFERKTLIEILQALFKQEKYEILINCIDRVGRFLLDRNYSQDGNQDMIKLILCLEKKSKDLKKVHKSAIKNCIKRLFHPEYEVVNDLRSFFFDLFNRNQQSHSDLIHLCKSLKNNKKFAIKMIVEFCLVSEPKMIHKCLLALDLDDFQIQNIIFLSIDDQKYRTLVLIEAYGIILGRKDKIDIQSLTIFIKKMLFCSIKDRETKFELVLSLLSYLKHQHQKCFIEYLLDYVEMQNNQQILIRFINFLNINGL